MLQAGVAVTDITPPVGSMMAAFPSGPNRTARRATEVRDPLRARVLAMSDGVESAVVCCCDVAFFREVDVQRIRERVASLRPSIAPERIMFAASHTHSSSETTYLFGNTPDDPYIHEMNGRIAQAIAEAAGRMEPVTLRLGRIPLELSHNRRVTQTDGRSSMVLQHDPERTTGPTDPDLTALRFERATGETLAVLWHWTAHALTVGPQTFVYTADYPGVACNLIEQRFAGAMALFLNGGAGNVHPRQCMRQNFEALEAVGREVGDAALRAVDAAEVISCDALSFASTHCVFPNRHDNSLEVRVELAALRIGDVRFVFMPGEPFVEFQLALRERVEPPPLVFVGYSNGWCGYVPTREAYESGGYGVDLHVSDAPDASRTALPPGAGETMVETLERLLAEVG